MLGLVGVCWKEAVAAALRLAGNVDGMRLGQMDLYCMSDFEFPASDLILKLLQVRKCNEICREDSYETPVEHKLSSA